MGDIVRSVNPEVGRLIHAVTVYFRAFSSGIESRQKDKLKKVKQKFEVAVKAGKLFEEEKLRHHYKDTTKVRRDTSLQILKILKEPAMKYSFDRKAPDEGTQSDLVTQPLFHFSESGSELPASTFVFTSESGKPLGGIADLSVKSKTLIQKMNAIFMEKTSVNDELEIKRAQLVALQADLKRSVSQDQKCKFHPTQKAIANMLADLRLYGLRPLYGAKFELQTISLLSELYVPLSETSNLVNQVKPTGLTYLFLLAFLISFYYFRPPTLCSTLKSSRPHSTNLRSVPKLFQPAPKVTTSSHTECSSF